MAAAPERSAGELSAVIGVCRGASSLSDAERKLFAASRARKQNPNDADRLRKYLARFGLSWELVSSGGNCTGVSARRSALGARRSALGARRSAHSARRASNVTASFARTERV
jgi:hypothetical protein